MSKELGVSISLDSMVYVSRCSQHQIKEQEIVRIIILINPFNIDDEKNFDKISCLLVNVKNCAQRLLSNEYAIKFCPQLGHSLSY